MGRAERPLEAGNPLLIQFATDLRQLREQAGSPPYRELGRRAHYSAGTLSDAASGRKLPSLAVTTAFVRACEGDVAQWERRWHDVASELAAEAEPARPEMDGERAPYLGLAPFGEEDTDLFFGRETMVKEALHRLDQHHLLVVLGASGVGKTSLLRAGLVPRIRPRGWPVATIPPGPHPIEECAIRLAALAGTSVRVARADLEAGADGLHLVVRRALAEHPDDARLLLVVDQLDEIITGCADPGELTKFVDALKFAARAPASRTRVVLVLRNGFPSHRVSLPDDSKLLVGPLSADELRAVITRPAVRAGCAIEGALLATLIAESAGQAGALPLISQALRETWRRRRGTTLTLAGYHGAGGIQHVLTHAAETTYQELEPAQQDLAKNLFRRLTAPANGTTDIRRRAEYAEFADDPDTSLVVARLADARVLHMDGNGVTIAHDLLLESWPRLRAWLSDDRDGRRIHHGVIEAAQLWTFLGRDPGVLYRGMRLELARSWARHNETALAARERNFLDASLTAGSTPWRTLRVVVVLVSLLFITAGASMHGKSGKTLKTGPARAATCLRQPGATRIVTDHGDYCYDGEGTVDVNQVQTVCAGDRPIAITWSSGEVHNSTTLVARQACQDFKEVPGDTWIHRIYSR